VVGLCGQNAGLDCVVAGIPAGCVRQQSLVCQVPNHQSKSLIPQIEEVKMSAADIGAATDALPLLRTDH
jgi:hypothetical protein